MTMTVEEGEEIYKIAKKVVFSVNYCYSAYPMVSRLVQWYAAVILVT